MALAMLWNADSEVQSYVGSNPHAVYQPAQPARSRAAGTSIVRHLILVIVLGIAAPPGVAQQAVPARVKNVSTPTMRFVGLAPTGNRGSAGTSAAPIPNALQTLPGITVVLNVPYSVEAPQPQLRRATIRCALLLRPNSAHVAEEQITIAVDGQAVAGTAPVTFAPVNNRNVAIARAYTCQLELSNGASTVYAMGDKGPPWARSQAGSLLIVRGTIE